MRYYKAEGIILKRTNSGEADRLVTIFTKDLGKLRLKAKGVRKILSKNRGNLEIFNCIKFSVVKGKQLDLITEVETLNSFTNLRSDLTIIGIAYHCCELIDRLLPDKETHPEIYELLKYYLQSIPAGSNSQKYLSEMVKEFETELLQNIGFGLPLIRSQRALVSHIENIIERPLKSRQFINLVLSNKK